MGGDRKNEISTPLPSHPYSLATAKLQNGSSNPEPDLATSTLMTTISFGQKKSIVLSEKIGDDLGLSEVEKPHSKVRLEPTRSPPTPSTRRLHECPSHRCRLGPPTPTCHLHCRRSRVSTTPRLCRLCPPALIRPCYSKRPTAPMRPCCSERPLGITNKSAGGLSY